MTFQHNSSRPCLNEIEHRLLMIKRRIEYQVREVKFILEEARKEEEQASVLKKI